MKLGTPEFYEKSLLQKRGKKVEIVKVEKERQSRGLKKTGIGGHPSAITSIKKKVEEKEVSHPKLYYKEELSKRENQNYYINIQKNKVNSE